MKGTDHLGDPDIQVWIIFRVLGCGTDTTCWGYGPVVGLCNHNNELEGSTKYE